MFQLLGDYVPRPPTGVTHMGSTGEYVPTRHMTWPLQLYLLDLP